MSVKSLLCTNPIREDDLGPSVSASFHFHLHSSTVGRFKRQIRRRYSFGRANLTHHTVEEPLSKQPPDVHLSTSLKRRLNYLVETEYLSSWWTQSTPATVIFLMSSFFIPMLDPLMVTEIRPLRGPKRGMICRRKEIKHTLI